MSSTSIPATEFPDIVLSGDVNPVYASALPQIPGFSIMAATVTYPPSGSTPPHRHGGAFVAAYVLEGNMTCAMNDDPEKTYAVGDFWMEMPGCHHKVSKNTSDSEGAKFIAVFVVESEKVAKGMEALLVFDDEKYNVKLRQVIAEKKKQMAAFQAASAAAGGACH